MKQYCLLIYGMHRSGTSAFAGMLNKGGIAMGNSLMERSHDNPKGFYEHTKVVDINEQILHKLGQTWDATVALPENWIARVGIQSLKNAIRQLITKEFKTEEVFALKDPRLSLTLPLWLSVFEELGIASKHYILVRHPYEVAASIEKRNHTAKPHAISLWLKYMVNAELFSRGTDRQFVSYQSVLENPESILSSIPFFDNSIFQKKGKNFINKQLRNHKAQEKISEPWLVEGYAAFLQLSKDSRDITAIDKLDTLQQSNTYQYLIVQQSTIATLSLDYGKGYNDLPVLKKEIDADTKKLTFDISNKNGARLQGLRFRPASILTSFLLKKIKVISADGQQVMPRRIIETPLLQSQNWYIFDKEGFIEIRLPTSVNRVTTLELDVVYRQLGENVHKDIKQIGQTLQSSNLEAQAIPNYRHGNQDVEIKPGAFWWTFIKTGFKYPISFLKNINAENLRILRRALANESPAIILSNLKKRLFEEHNGEKPNFQAALPSYKSHSLNSLPNKSLDGEKLGAVLYVFSDLPDYDSSSGGKRATRILDLLTTHFEVYVFTLGSRPPKYIRRLESLGIRIVETTNYKQVKKALPTIKAVIFSVYRTFLESQRFSELYPSAKIIIDTVDINWVREERSLGVWQGLTHKRVEINKEKEIKAYQAADLIWAVTEQDRQAILQFVPDALVRIVSNVHDSIVTTYEDNGANTLLFIGGFTHYPNISAVKILARQVLPKVRAEIPQVQLIIVGSNAPEEVRQLGELPNVVFKGYVEEADLDRLYEHSFLSVSPLLVGAGIKGKICEAIAYRTPVITNDIGNEGINLIHEREGLISGIEEMPALIVSALKREYDFGEMTQKAQSKLSRLVGSAIVQKEMLLSIFPMINICIVTWNRLHLLKKCLDSIKKNTIYPNYRITVYSNACADGTAEYLLEKAKSDDRLIPIIAEENEVFVRPNNKMMGMHPEGDVVLLNNDVEVTNRWLISLQEVAYQRDDYGIVGSKLLYPNGVLQEFGAEIYADGSGYNIGRGDSPNQKRYNQLKEVGYVSACSMFIKRSTIDQVGLLDDQFHPCYFEDSDYCYRAKDFGLKTVVTPKSIVYHKEGGTAGNDTSTGFKQYQRINRQKFLAKHKMKLRN